jgi:hypothetical protein
VAKKRRWNHHLENGKKPKFVTQNSSASRSNLQNSINHDILRSKFIGYLRPEYNLTNYRFLSSIKIVFLLFVARTSENCLNTYYTFEFWCKNLGFWFFYSGFKILFSSSVNFGATVDHFIDLKSFSCARNITAKFYVLSKTGLGIEIHQLHVET